MSQLGNNAKQLEYRFQAKLLWVTRLNLWLCGRRLNVKYFVRTHFIVRELNNRTKEARPRNFVTDENRFYQRSWPNGGIVLIKVEYSFVCAGRCPRTFNK